MKLARVAKNWGRILLKGKGLLVVPLFCLVLGILSLVSGGEANAAAKTWVGGASSNALWSDANNWSPAGAPVDGDAINFNCNDANVVCASIMDIPGLRVASINISGSVGANISNSAGAPIYLAGGITSSAPGSIVSVDIILDSDVEVNNTVLGAVDLNGHQLTIKGKGVTKPSSTGMWIGISGDITGAGALDISADADQEVYLSGDNTYSGVTYVNSGKFVSNGQSSTNATMDMFGVSDVNVGPLGKVVFTFSEAEAGFSFDNRLTFNRLDPALAQLLAVNKTSNGASLSVAFSNIELKSASRFDVDVSSGGLLVNLDGVVANNYCIEYGQNNTQSSYFQNGPICLGDKEAEVQVPLKPKTGVVASSVTVVVVAAIIVLASYQIRKNKKLDSISNEK